MLEAPLASPFGLTTTATAVLDGQGKIIGWSAAAEQLLGFSAETVRGKPIQNLFSVLDDEVLLGPNAEPGRWSQPRVLRHQDGRPVNTVIYLLPLGPSDAEACWAVFVIAEDQMERWSQDQAVLAGLSAESPIALTVYGPDSRVRWVSHSLEQQSGIPFEDWVGRYVRDILPDGKIVSPEHSGRPLEEVIDGVFRTGEPVVDLHYHCFPASDPVHQRVFSCSYFRLQDAQGRLLGVCESGFEVTARYEAQQRLTLLGRSSSIGRTLDVTRTAEELIAVTVPDLADLGWVELAEPVLTGDVPSTQGERSPLRLVAESTASARAQQYSWPRPDASAGPRRAILPLTAGSVVLGQVTFLRLPPRDPFSDIDLALAEELISHTAVCMDNARRFAHEQQTALLLQRNLLPHTLAQPTAAEIAHYYAPTTGPQGVGGDWYDVIPLSGSRIGFVVGDVVGRGLNAAATMGRLRTTVRALAGLDLEPDELLSRLSELAGQARIDAQREADHPDDQAIGARCLYAVYDPVSRRCELASAGHHPPVLVDPGGRAVCLDIPIGLSLGIDNLPYESAEFEVADNSLLVLFTDGLVTRRPSDAIAGEREICRLLSRHSSRHPPLSSAAACSVIAEWHATDPAPDDAAALVALVHCLPADHVAVLPVATDYTEVAAARTWALEQLTSWELKETSFVTEMIVSELVTNAIRYGSEPILLRLLRDGDSTLICEVSDGGHTSPHLRRASTDDEGGRGLFLVAQLAERWGTRYTRGGKTIWAEVPIGAGEAVALADAFDD
ncbi:SpoIIE family protein phosphatase [Streptomyces europaeiscabiei]|uniref:ATP-binding SpoIIE family protein phosphatase n=1 Tax=Streptomyces europaeiscabiei TaxID=146819 RepID=UPI002E10E07F|nr:SpoIIE family protein phosphatase [Streptomyces europaeiscabiei]